MTAYWSNKAASIILPGIIFLGLYISQQSEVKFWQSLLMSIIAFGYMHFLVGYYYQIRTLIQKTNPHFEIMYFLGMSIFGLVIVGMFYKGGIMHYMPFFIIPYFMLHGFFNERNLYTRQTERAAPSGLMGSIALWLTSVALLSFFHPSAFYTSTLQFASNMDALLAIARMPDALRISLLLLGWAGILVSFFILLKTIIRDKYYTVTIPLLLIGLFVTLQLFIGGPFNNIYMQYILLMYHFATWMFFYGVQFSRKRKKFGEYVMLHVMVLIVCSIPFLPSFEGLKFSELVFNANIFIIFSTIHITTSFLNEDWFKRGMIKIWNA